MSGSYFICINQSTGNNPLNLPYCFAFFGLQTNLLNMNFANKTFSNLLCLMSSRNDELIYEL